MTTTRASLAVLVGALWFGATIGACTRPLFPTCECPPLPAILEGPMHVERVCMTSPSCCSASRRNTCSSRPELEAARVVVERDRVVITYDDGGEPRTVTYRAR